MSFISFQFYIFLIISLFIFYIVPVKFRWIVLFIASFSFYFLIDKRAFAVFVLTSAVSYLLGLLIHKTSDNGKIKKTILWVSIIIIVFPLVYSKIIMSLIKGFFDKPSFFNFIAPVGLAFYTLQIIAYFVDIYKGKIDPEQNILKYMLFISYFPQIIQGPIPRYEQLGTSLFSEHRFNEEMFTKGFQLILWGFFLKLMIADKAAVVVNTIFETNNYVGLYYLVGILLYILQLYTDFQGCVCIAQGVSALFGVEIIDNFKRPFFSKTTKEFWTRWHISLGAWLRDYIYFPLGGSRVGRIRKWLNLSAVFITSALWHGFGLNYVVWGLLQVLYQAVGELTDKSRDIVLERLNVNGKFKIFIQILFTNILFIFSVFFFKAKSVSECLGMFKSMVTCYNPWIFFDNSLFDLGLSWKEMVVLILSALILLCVSIMQECGIMLRNEILKAPMLFRWVLYLFVIVTIVIYGTYGFGFNAQDFIYGGF